MAFAKTIRPATEELIEAAYLAGFEPSSDDLSASQELREAMEYLINTNA